MVFLHYRLGHGNARCEAPLDDRPYTSRTPCPTFFSPSSFRRFNGGKWSYAVLDFPSVSVITGVLRQDNDISVPTLEVSDTSFDGGGRELLLPNCSLGLGVRHCAARHYRRRISCQIVGCRIQSVDPAIAITQAIRT
jgi:hypothetical protein